ncbi:hypothetical protein D3C78_1017030 [compost metagenome]
MKTPECHQRPADAFLMHAARQRQSLAKAAQDLFVEQHRGRAGKTFIYNKTNGVRTNIYDGNGGKAGQPPLCF